MMPRPIHVLVRRAALVSISRHPVCREEKIKFSSTFFKRWQVSSGQRLLVELRRARNTFIVQAPFEGKSRETNCLAAWGTFCKRKSSQLTTDSYNPEKPPGGRFFCCRTTKPSERKTAQRLFRRSAAGDSEAPLLPPRGTAKRLPRRHDTAAG